MVELPSTVKFAASWVGGTKGQQRTSPSPTMQPLEKHESPELFMNDPNSPRMAGNLRVWPLGVV
jgi:hypothetical protein